MSRYIDADKLVEKYERVIENEWNKKTSPSSWAEAFDCVISDIDDEPTADVVEVRHGEWYIREYEFFTCSECGHDHWNSCEYTAQAKERLKNGEHPNYCPNCGAKMSGERRSGDEG